MAEAITVAERTIPGKPVRVEMGKDLGHSMYQVEILDKDNKSRWVYVDAMSGAVTEAKRSSRLYRDKVSGPKSERGIPSTALTVFAVMLHF